MYILSYYIKWVKTSLIYSAVCRNCGLTQQSDFLPQITQSLLCLIMIIFIRKGLHFCEGFQEKLHFKYYLFIITNSFVSILCPLLRYLCWVCVTAAARLSSPALPSSDPVTTRCFHRLKTGRCRLYGTYSYKDPYFAKQQSGNPVFRKVVTLGMFQKS